MDGISDAFDAQIALAEPVLATVFGSVIGLVFIIAIGYFIVRRVRGSVK